jgi:hypothetical protein
MLKIIIALISLAACGAALADEPHGATDIVVYQRAARGDLSGMLKRQTHGEPITFSRQFSYLVGTDRPTDIDGHWSMTISNLQYGANGDSAFDVGMEGKDPGVWEGKSTAHVLIDQGAKFGVVHGIDGKDYRIELRRLAANRP